LQEVTQINLLEATAYRRQLDKAAGRGVQKEDYLSHINFIYQGIVGTLERISVKNDFERKAINSEIY